MVRKEMVLSSKRKKMVTNKEMKTVLTKEKHPVRLGKASRMSRRTASSSDNKSNQNVFQLSLVSRVIKVNTGRCIQRLRNMHLV